MTKNYFIWNIERNMWWCSMRRGYTSDMQWAGIYSEYDAKNITERQFGGLPVNNVMVPTDGVKEFFFVLAKKELLSTAPTGEP